MTPYQLKDRLGQLIKTERQTTNEILKLLNLALKTKAYLQLGYPSLFEWLVKGFGYSNAAAFRRIEAARLLNTLPEISKKLEAGTVNLSTLSKTQSIIKAQEKACSQKFSPKEIAQVVEKIENKSTFETEQILTGLFPEAAKSITQERRTVISAEVTRLAVNLDAKTLEDLKRAREVLSHHSTSDAEVIAYALRFLLAKKDPLRRKGPLQKKDPLQKKECASQEKSDQKDQIQNPEKRFFSFKRADAKKGVQDQKGVGDKKRTQDQERAQNQEEIQNQEWPQDQKTNPIQSTSDHFRSGSARANPGQPKSISALRPRIITAGGGRCSYSDSVTNKICGSRHLIQVDHRQPRALGGSNHPSNLCLLCRSHNLLMAERHFGRAQMQKFLKDR